MDFSKGTLDGHVDTCAPSSAIPEADLSEIRVLASQLIIKVSPTSKYWLLTDN